MADPDIHAHISELIASEKTLRAQVGRGEISAAEEQQKLRAVEAELDRLWDLLRQRDAKREFGENPDNATERSADVVENYRN